MFWLNGVDARIKSGHDLTYPLRLLGVLALKKAFNAGKAAARRGGFCSVPSVPYVVIFSFSDSPPKKKGAEKRKAGLNLPLNPQPSGNLIEGFNPPNRPESGNG
jgi:hypothetical protein